MAAVDGQMAREELELIYEIVDTEGLPEAVGRRLYAYAVEPPTLGHCLWTVRDAPEAVRHGLMINLVEVAVSDYLLSEAEREALTEAQLLLGIGDQQRAAMMRYAEEVRRIRERGIDDNHAVDAIKTAVSGMTAVGVPITAVVYSGSVAGLSAAGITSGLAALGLGLGMVPGIGVAILIGTAAFVGLNYIFDTGASGRRSSIVASASGRPS